jgi:hypothetical protein
MFVSYKKPLTGTTPLAFRPQESLPIVCHDRRTHRVFDSHPRVDPSSHADDGFTQVEKHYSAGSSPIGVCFVELGELSIPAWRKRSATRARSSARAAQPSKGASTHACLTYVRARLLVVPGVGQELRRRVIPRPRSGPLLPEPAPGRLFGEDRWVRRGSTRPTTP